MFVELNRISYHVSNTAEILDPSTVFSRVLLNFLKSALLFVLALTPNIFIILN